MTSQAVREFRAKGVRWWIADDVDSQRIPQLRALCEDVDRVLESEASVARARMGRKRFYRIQGGVGGVGEPNLFVKSFALRGALARCLSIARPSKAQREANVARLVRGRGFAVIAPAAVGEERKLGALARSFVVTLESPGRDLRAYRDDRSLDAKSRCALVESFGALNRRLHDAGVDQDDSAPNNFLVAPDGRFLLLDFERCAVGAALSLERRVHLLAKLARHAQSSSQQLRFLRAYQGQGSTRAERREAWRAAERQLALVRRRDARRAAEGAFQIGRHIAPQDGGYVVRGRESWPSELHTGDPVEARHLWILAHQLERLGLPALRPVRLTSRGLELEQSSSELPLDPRTAARARRTLERAGRFTAPPEWRTTPEGPRLHNLRAFELRSSHAASGESL